MTPPRAWQFSRLSGLLGEVSSSGRAYTRASMAEASIDPLTPIAFLERTVRVFPNKTAVVYGDRRWTYAQFTERVGRFAGALKRAGVGPGDRVAVLAPNVPEVLEAHFAVLRAGAVLVAINTRLNASEVGYILNHSGAKVVIADVDLAPQVVNASDGLRANQLPTAPRAIPSDLRISSWSRLIWVDRVDSGC